MRCTGRQVPVNGAKLCGGDEAQRRLGGVMTDCPVATHRLVSTRRRAQRDCSSRSRGSMR